MSTTAEIVPATQAHVDAVTKWLRPSDLDEIQALSRHSPAYEVQRAVALSRRPLAVTYEGNPLCVFGVIDTNIIAGHGSPWMLGTIWMSQTVLPFLRGSMGVVDRMKADYNYLFNFVDARNTLTVRWLKWLGFSMSEPVPAGRHGEPIRRFEWRV